MATGMRSSQRYRLFGRSDSSSTSSSDSSTNESMDIMMIAPSSFRMVDMTREFGASSSTSATNSTVARRRITERTSTLQAVGRDAKEIWKRLSHEHQIDKEFILHALKNSPTLPAKSDFERVMPQSLRFDRDVVLAWCKREDFVELYYDRHLFVPDPLKGDKEVMIAYCSKIPRSLQECSEDLCNDRQVVEAAISLGGLELQYASLSLQEDKPLVVHACQNHGRALEYCPPGPTRNELLHDREFMYNVVLAKPGGGPMWKLIPPTLRKNDPDLLLQALKHGLWLREVPQEYWRVDFFRRALQSNSSLYMQLSKVWQSKPELALEAVVAADSTTDTHERALELIPSLKIHRQVVLAICERGDVSFLQALLTDSDFCDDEQIMTLAIKRDSKIFSMASPRLQVLPAIILASITSTSAWNTLKTVPWSIQRQHPEIPVEAVKVCISRNLRYLPSHIPEELWKNHEEHPQHRELCRAWIQRGGRILESFESSLSNDTELAILVAKHNWPEFYKVGETLLADRAFMLRALEQDGRVLRFAASPLRQDFDMLITSVAHHPPRNNRQSSSEETSQPVYNSSHNSSLQTTLGGICTISDLRRRIQNQLNLQNSFLMDFLRGIAIATPHLPPHQRSKLAMLDRGVETSHYFKQLIGEYLGVPTGTKLRLLREAKDHLQSCSMVASSTSMSTARSGSRRMVVTATANAVNAGAMEAAILPNRWAANQNHLRRRRERLRRLRHHREVAARRGAGARNDDGDNSDDDFMDDSDNEREEENHMLLQHQRLLQMGHEWEPEIVQML